MRKIIYYTINNLSGFPVHNFVHKKSRDEFFDKLEDCHKKRFSKRKATLELDES
jgi:hypothetical protein